MTVGIVKDRERKPEICRQILEALTDWFEVVESREKYIRDSADQLFVAAFDEDRPVGFLTLTETGKDTMEIHVMGILKEYHRKGIGRALFAKAKEIIKNSGYSFIQVKTVKMGVYDEYDKTNLFYLSLGFKELEVIPELWGEDNPCQIYVMYTGA